MAKLYEDAEKLYWELLTFEGICLSDEERQAALMYFANMINRYGYDQALLQLMSE